MLTICIFMAALLPLAAGAQQQYTITVDDFETDTLDRWQTSQSPEYYRGGEGREGLQIVDDPEQGRVLQARLAFADERASEPRFITRTIEDPIPARHVLQATVRYKIEGVDQAPIESMRLRLRTAPNAFNDYDILPETGAVVGEWYEAVVAVRANMSMRNVYRNVFGEIQQVTLRLDDVDDLNSEFLLLVDEITLTVEEPPEPTYEPTDRALQRDDRLDVLLITHSTAGFYDIEGAARAIDPDARVDRYLFRGLHFPLWGFPESIDDLLAYDVIAMVDVDPWVLSHEQATWLADLVHSGAGLVFFGGPQTLTHAQDFRLPLREALPVTFEQGAADLSAGGPPTAIDHPITAGLLPERLGAVAQMHDLTPREGAVIPLTVGDRPLLICGQFGSGRVALVNAWTQLGGAKQGRFLGTDLADDFMRSLLRWTSGRIPQERLTSVKLPPTSVIAPETVSVSAEAQGASAIRLQVGDNEPQVADGAGPASFELQVAHAGESERTIPCALEALNADGRVADRITFEIEALNPLGIDVAWAAHQYTFEPGAAVQFEVALNPRGLPQVEASGSNLDVTLAQGSLPMTIAGLGDVWVVPPGTDTVLHDQSGPAEVETSTEGDGLLPTITTTGITRADRESMSFGDDPRIQRVQRTARVRADGGVRIDHHYEFLQDVQVHRISTMITLPASVYAGMPFTARQQEKTVEGTFPVETGRRLFDGHGLDLTIETPEGPLRIEVPDESLRVWMQDLRQYEMGTFRLEIEAPFEETAARAGDTYDVPIVITGPGTDGHGPVPAGEALAVECSLVDDQGAAAFSFPAVEGEARADVNATLPNLRTGQYELAVSVLADGETISRTSRTCYVVDPLDRANFYPIMSVMGIDSGEHMMDREMIQARLDDMWAHGMNAAAEPNARSLGDPGLSHGESLDVFAQSYAQRLGMASFYEYHSLSLINRAGPTNPSVFDPAHMETLRDHVEGQFDVCDRTARCLSIKIIDEPHVRAEHLRAEYCAEPFRERYGAEFVPVDEVGEDIAARWRLADFLGYYVDRAYGMTEEIRKEHPGEWDLLLTFNSPGLGYGGGYTWRQDIRSWAQHTGMSDFDIYPYFYPASQKVRMVQADFGLSIMRSFGQHLDIPWGFYVELDDRNWPYQKNPKEASAECAFTAVAQGADYLNTFIHRGFGTGVSSRPERWEEAGRAFRAIRRVGPLLNRMQRPRASAAMIYPMGQAMVNDGHRPAQYTFAAMRQGFGMSDAVSSELFIEDPTQFDRDALVLLDCEILDRTVAERLVQFVRDGGTLVLYQAPSVDTRGEALEFPWSFEGVEAEALPGLPELTRRILEDGDGRVIMLDFDFEEAYTQATEEDMFERVASLREAMGLLLEPASALCNADDAPGQMEAGLRLGDDAALVTIVNHHPEENASTVRVNSLPFKPRWAVDMITMEAVGIDAGEGPGSCVFDVRLPGRNSQMVALLPERPQRVEVEVADAEFERGAELSYRVRVLGDGARPAAGQHLLEIAVTGPDGREITRLGGSAATDGGEFTRVIAVPVNALPGDYAITVSVPQIGEEATVAFTVAE